MEIVIMADEQGPRDDHVRFTTDDCKMCKGKGHVLARLTPEQDFALARVGKAIPKVDCPRCLGLGLEPIEDGMVTAPESQR